MARRHGVWGVSRIVGLLGGLVMGISSFGSAVQAEDPSCASLSATLSRDPTSSDAFQVVRSEKLYRFQERPYARMPLGVKVLLRAPEGVSEADVHRAALCGARSASSESPLSVPETAVRVVRSGAHYELHITSQKPVQAREVQRRAEGLR
jgi:hypothetical protein